MICVLCHIEIEGKGGWIIEVGKGYVGPPLKLLRGPGPLPPSPLPTPMNRIGWLLIDSPSFIRYCGKLISDSELKQSESLIANLRMC